jgi:hypothetical protein
VVEQLITWCKWSLNQISLILWIQVLSKFEEVSMFMSSEACPTVCWVIQKAFCLENVLSKVIATNQGRDNAPLQ